MRIQAGVTIERPIEDVFEFISDPRNDPQWCGYVRSCEQVVGDGPKVGARYQVMHDPRPGKPVPLSVEVRELEPPHRMVLWEEDFAATLLVTYELEALDTGRTRMTQTSQLRNKGVWKLMSPISFLGVWATLPKQCAALKQRLESTATDGHEPT